MHSKQMLFICIRGHRKLELHRTVVYTNIYIYSLEYERLGYTEDFVDSFIYTGILLCIHICISGILLKKNSFDV